MAVDFNDQTQAQNFKDYMSSQGIPQEEIDAMIEWGKGNTSPMGEVGEVASVETIQPAALETPTPIIPDIVKPEETIDEPTPEPTTQNIPQVISRQPANEPAVEAVGVEQPMATAQLNGEVTQRFGNPNPRLYGRDKRGRANINRGVDISAEPNEPQAAPKSGEWVVDSVYAGDGFNTGWGRSVVIKNTQTGETIRRSHLDKVMVKPGQKVTGQVIGTTGRTGRTTGYHKDIEYTDPKGRLSDFTKSPYAKE